MINDPSIRSTLIESLHRKHAGEDYAVKNEMKIYNRIADVVIVNGSFAGYEIKSEVDNLDRLIDQLNVFEKVFEYFTLVCVDRHVAKASRMLSAETGIAVFNVNKSSFSIRSVKKPIKRRISSGIFATMLSKSELACMAKILEVDARNLGKFALEEKLSRLPQNKVREAFLVVAKTKIRGC